MQGRRLIIIVEIVLSETEVVHRLASRLVCKECGTNAQDTSETLVPQRRRPRVPRVDDAEEVGGYRLAVYRTRQTEPLVEYYRGRPHVSPRQRRATPDGRHDGDRTSIEAAASETLVWRPWSARRHGWSSPRMPQRASRGRR